MTNRRNGPTKAGVQKYPWLLKILVGSWAGRPAPSIPDFFLVTSNSCSGHVYPRAHLECCVRFLMVIEFAIELKSHLRLGSAVLRSPINTAQRRMHLRPYSLSQLDPSACSPASDDHAGRLREKRIVVVVSAVASDHCRNIAARLISELFFRGSNAIRSALLVASVLNRFLGFIKCSMMDYFIFISVRVFSSVSVAS